MELLLPPSLEQMLAARPPGGFKAVAVYSEKGNMVKWHWDEEPAYEEPVAEGGVWVGSLLRAFSDKRVVGIKLHLESVVGFPGIKLPD